MRVLVTGATGSIGDSVLTELHRANHSIRVMGRRPAESAPAPSAEFVHRDLAFPESLQVEDFTGCDAVVWMAVHRDTTRSMDVVNVDAVRKAALLADRAGVSVFVLFSTISVYGTPTTSRIDERSPTIDPYRDTAKTFYADGSLREYGASKLRGELALRSAVGTMRALIVRPTVILPQDTTPHAPTGYVSRLLWARRRTHFIAASKVGRDVARLVTLARNTEPGSVTVLNIVDSAGEHSTYRDAWAAPRHPGVPRSVLRALDWWRYSRRLPVRYPLSSLTFDGSRAHEWLGDSERSPHST
jgi:nucleoside-diphosphate-sugar epimerase